MRKPTELIALIAGYVVEYFMYVMFGGLPFSKSIVEVCASVGFVFWLIKKAALGEFKLVKTPANLAIFAFLIVNLIAACHTNYPDKSLEAFFFKVIEFVVFYFMIAESMNTWPRIRNSVAVLIISLMLASIDGIYQFFNRVDFMRHKVLQGGMHITGPFSMPTDFGGYLTMVIPLVLCLLIFGPKKKWKLFLFTASLVSIACLALTFSRAALLGLLAAIALIGLARSKKTLIITAALIALVFLIPNPIGKNLKSVVDPRHPSNDWRLARWGEVVDMIKDKPFFGHGLNTFSRNYAPYYNDYKYYSAHRPTIESGLPYAHNCYLQMAAETGIIGLAMFLWVLAAFYAFSVKTARNLNDNAFYNALILGLLGGITACLVQSAFDTNMYSLQLSNFCWALMGLIVAANRAALE